jgi:hypothetical protein
VNSNMDTPAHGVKRNRSSGGRRPPIEPGQALTRAQVMFRQKIGPNTLKTWEKLGLQMYRPPGSTERTTGDDVLEFIKRFPVQQPDAKPSPKKRKR